MITNGVVSFEDGKKQIEGDQFSLSKKARVELTFIVNEGEDAEKILNGASIVAKAKVYEMIDAALAKVAAKGSVDTKPAAMVAEPAPATVKGKPGRKAKATEPADDTDAIGDDASKTPANTIMEGLEEEPQTVVLSDKALYDTVVAINGKIKKPAEITAIVGKYCPNDGTPPSVRRIPEGKRAAFLKEIEAFAATFAKK